MREDRRGEMREDRRGETREDQREDKRKFIIFLEIKLRTCHKVVGTHPHDDLVRAVAFFRTLIAFKSALVDSVE